MRRFFLLIVVALSLTALACSTGYNRYPRYPNYPRNPSPYPPNYPGYPGPNGGYGYGSQSIRTLADSLERETKDLLDEAKDQRHHDNDAEDNAINKLEDLNNEAQDFRDEVEDSNDDYDDSYRQGPYGNGPYGNGPYGGPYGGGNPYGNTRSTSDDFRDLLKKYTAARHTIDDLHGYNEVYRDFDRVTRIMAQLSQMYGYRFQDDDRYYGPVVR
jgi:hypothetical protein